MNKYYILSIVIGILNKLYDDIYDNNLYKTLGISKKKQIILKRVFKMFICIRTGCYFH
jgi:hypothetical protein